MEESTEKRLYLKFGMLILLETVTLLALFKYYQSFYHKKLDIFSVFVIFCFGVSDLVALMQIIKIKNNMNKSEYRKYLLEKLESEPDIDQQKDAKDNRIEEIVGECKINPSKSDVLALLLENNDKIEYYFNWNKNNDFEKKDIFALMLKNNDEITDYFIISKWQAKLSFLFSIIACVIGITMIGLSIYGFFTMKDTQFAIIGIVGGAITELIAGTVLVIHNKSALQLNYYYDALHENEKTLSAINLADKLPEDERVQMYIEIIRAQIGESKIEKKSQEK
ncbi:MAG: hypothetical protein K2K70_06055 [Lachnospiraceae bacterium]|nr:hypothetical protein [Lachnospiraceae bacterium]